jgi:hypothetical protein
MFSFKLSGLFKVKSLLLAITILLAVLVSCHPAFAATKIKIGALKFGSFSWLLDTIQLLELLHES